MITATTERPRTVEINRISVGDLWCFGCRQRQAHFDVLLDHADPGRRSPYLGPWWSRQCASCSEDHTCFPGCGPL